MINGIKVIGFDADDTLWVNEPYYREAENEFVELVSSYGVNGNIAEALFDTEIANLRLYGYGIKAFMLSLVECAIELTDGGVSTRDINRIIGIGKSMLERPIELLDDVKQVLKTLAPHYRLIVATKGDLLEGGCMSVYDHIAFPKAGRTVEKIFPDPQERISQIQLFVLYVLMQILVVL